MPLYESRWAAECRPESRGGFEEIQAMSPLFSELKRSQAQPRTLSSPLLCRPGPAAEQRADGAHVAGWDMPVPSSGSQPALSGCISPPGLKEQKVDVASGTAAHGDFHKVTQPSASSRQDVQPGHQKLFVING